jgi:thioredoxin 1
MFHYGGSMKKKYILIISICAFFLVGVGVLMWSARQSGYPLANLISGKATENHELSKIKTITDDNFELEVVQASKEKPILIDFYADWCFPCRMLDPILEELAKDMGEKAVIGRVNTDKNLIARRFGITKIPAIFIIRNGEVKGSFFGVVPKETIAKTLMEHVS